MYQKVFCSVDGTRYYSIWIAVAMSLPTIIRPEEFPIVLWRTTVQLNRYTEWTLTYWDLGVSSTSLLWHFAVDPVNEQPPIDVESESAVENCREHEPA